jgi:hypothetical protein
MHRSGNDFTYIHDLRRGKHAFKFIVDDEWRFAPDQPTVADIEGRINNFIDVTDFKVSLFRFWSTTVFLEVLLMAWMLTCWSILSAGVPTAFRVRLIITFSVSSLAIHGGHGF